MMQRALFLALWLCAAPALAHTPSDAFLVLRHEAAGVSGHLDVALVDLDHVLALDADRQGAVTWDEVRAAETRIQVYVRERLRVLASSKNCELVLAPLGIVEHADGAHARVPLSARCAEGALPTAVHYDLLFDVDPQHRGLAELGGTLRILSATERTLALGTPSSQDSSFAATFRLGVGHILAGLDHILFLLALLLPALLRREPRLADVLKTVTAFTLAHSLTLVLSALSLVRVPAYLIEPAIALSVALAALNNLRPVFQADRWTLAFALGLLHGFGFSSALGELGLTGLALLAPLCAFNLGVEAGQLAIVLLFVPIALTLERRERPRRALLHGGSLAILALSLFWVFERLEKG